MIAIIDYGAGNLQSVKKALDFIGTENIITNNKKEIMQASHIILPGVGSFGDAMDNMEKSGLVETVKRVANSGKPFLGICLGLHLLFESSEESPCVKGLGILPGNVVKFPSNMGLKVPHMGWNSISVKEDGGIFKGVETGSYVYFVHSYYLQADKESDVSATSDYGIGFHCAVQHGNIFATQFHPEKSSEIGMKILKNFVEMKGEE